MRFLTIPCSLDDPHGPRVLMGVTASATQNGTRITTTVFPDHEGRVIAARRVYLATLDETPSAMPARSLGAPARRFTLSSRRPIASLLQRSAA